ncbi:MAG: polymerase [Chthoniobacter sp.]|nr:polymerase [Chthoniobacter sp.]
METRLRTAGIHTVEALCAAPRGHLRAIWGGVEGERMFDSLRGETILRPPTRKCMLGHSHVLAPALRNDEDALAVLHRLLQKAAMRLRKEGYLARGLQLFVEFLHVGGFCEEMLFLETQDTIALARSMEKLWERRPRVAQPPLMVGVDLTNLVSEKNYTPALSPEDGRRRKLFASIDALNVRYGKNALYFGGSHRARDSAPMRIAFNRVPDLQTEAD